MLSVSCGPRRSPLLSAVRGTTPAGAGAGQLAAARLRRQHCANLYECGVKVLPELLARDPQLHARARSVSARRRPRAPANPCSLAPPNADSPKP
jgi:hypothetical protein